MKYNMLWDGVFHAATWLMTGAGVLRLWVAGRASDALWSPPAFGGGLLLGWGLFNSLEGLVDHQLLALHHVHPGVNQVEWDVGFLLSGVLMLGTGAWLVRKVCA